VKYLIVTADDFGLTESINEGIIKARSEGIVTAASMIPTGEAFEQAAAAAKDVFAGAVGAHLALTETKPLLKTSKKYKNHNSFYLALLSGAVTQEDIYAELKTQIELIRSKGLRINHINSHEHVHMIPRVLEIFVRLANEYGIPAIRFPRGDRPPKALSLAENLRACVLSHFRGGIEKALKRSGLVFTDSFMGLIDAGRLDIGSMQRLIGLLTDGVTELVTHPGFLSPDVLYRHKWHINCETELFALTDKSVKGALEDFGVKLITFDEFLKMRLS
jgi:predicted glycoside hydrolase/deacetylase ChbG (UPF0249 family)